jgi:hypothetical protein
VISLAKERASDFVLKMYIVYWILHAFIIFFSLAMRNAAEVSGGKPIAV